MVVTDSKDLDRVEQALGKATKQFNEAIDSGDHDKLPKALAMSDDQIDDAVDS